MLRKELSKHSKIFLVFSAGAECLDERLSNEDAISLQDIIPETDICFVSLIHKYLLFITNCFNTSSVKNVFSCFSTVRAMSG